MTSQLIAKHSELFTPLSSKDAGCVEIKLAIEEFFY